MTIIDDMREKLDEAKYNLKNMENSQATGTKQEFTYAFSSFLTSIRIVTQYALEHKKQAYDSLISNLKYKGVFTDLRNENIHAKPVRTSNAGQNFLTVSITVSNGESEADTLEEDEDTEEIGPFSKNEYYYIFEGQFDTPEYRDKTLVALASLYVDEVEKFISDFEQLI
ncbi:hypothetical protein [Lysinibacillus capsici]|uniref:hypothetical protein n=1 Tax=Lysinibacillus capsici TaxID=2115968 RepID=UPI000E1FEF36|nr:hypothetical protein [Lysinibacillus capsici]RDV27666.1 hypothetical protein C7B89_19720 [Lysinibacillus capsici]